MDVFNYRHVADTYQASVNSLVGDQSQFVRPRDNVMPPESANTSDTSAMSNVASAINDPNVVYKSKTHLTVNDLAPQWSRKTEMNINGVGNLVNVTA